MQCLVCERSVEKFLPYGIPERIGRCPHCGSKSRHREMGLVLKNLLRPRLKVGTRLLEVGPSKVTVKKLFDPHFIGAAQVTIIDIRKLRHHESLPAHAVFEAQNVCQMTFPNDHFDVVICNQVFSFLADYKKAIQELSRVLKPNGVAVLNVERVGAVTRPASELVAQEPDRFTPEFLEENGTEWYFGDDYFKTLQLLGLNSHLLRWRNFLSSQFLAANAIKPDADLPLAAKSPDVLKKLNWDSLRL